MKLRAWNKNEPTRIVSVQNIVVTAAIFGTMISFNGCHNSKLEVVRKLDFIRAGLENIERSNNALLSTNNNEWQWSQLPGLERVSWRAIVLKYTVPIGFRDDVQLSEHELNEAIAEQIEWQGNALFRIDDMLIEGNLEQIEGISLSSLPDFFVVAYTVLPKNGYGWNSSQESTIAEIVAGDSKQCAIPEKTYLLFANGSIGTIEGRKIADIRDAFDLNSSGKLTKQHVKSIGVRMCSEE